LKSSDGSVSGVSTSPQSEPDESHGLQTPESLFKDMLTLSPMSRGYIDAKKIKTEPSSQFEHPFK
jgi:hypothetical protein